MPSDPLLASVPYMLGRRLARHNPNDRTQPTPDARPKQSLKKSSVLPAVGTSVFLVI
jgi:hypothetical protein